MLYLRESRFLGAATSPGVSAGPSPSVRMTSRYAGLIRTEFSVELPFELDDREIEFEAGELGSKIGDVTLALFLRETRVARRQ